MVSDAITKVKRDSSVNIGVFKRGASPSFNNFLPFPLTRGGG